MAGVLGKHGRIRCREGYAGYDATTCDAHYHLPFCHGCLLVASSRKTSESRQALPSNLSAIALDMVSSLELALDVDSPR